MSHLGRTKTGDYVARVRTDKEKVKKRVEKKGEGTPKRGSE